MWILQIILIIKVKDIRNYHIIIFIYLYDFIFFMVTHYPYPPEGAAGDWRWM